MAGFYHRSGQSPDFRINPPDYRIYRGGGMRAWKIAAGGSPVVWISTNAAK